MHKRMKKIKASYRYIIFPILIFFIATFFPQISSAINKISNKNTVKTFWQEAAIMPGAAKYFIRTEKIEKKTSVSNNHPIKIDSQILRSMLKQLSYKYDRDQPEIPLFSSKELMLLAENVSLALKVAGPKEDVTFVVKGQHSSARWAMAEERLTAGRIFVSNNQLNLILGAVQVNLQPTIDERYQGNVWETTKLTYDIGYRKKTAKYEGLITVYNQKKRGIFRKSSKRKDWFVFTNLAYKQAIEGDSTTTKKSVSPSQYRSLQEQIDALQKDLNKKKQMPKQNIKSQPRQNTPKKQYQDNRVKTRNNPKEKEVALEQRLKTIEALHKKGILSEEEYQSKRREILSGL